MDRFMVYSNQFDVEGLVAATSVRQKQTVAAWRTREIVEVYGKVGDKVEKPEQGSKPAANLLAMSCEGRADCGMKDPESAPLIRGARLVLDVS